MVVVVLGITMIMLTKMLVVILLFIFSNFSTDNHDYYHLREKNDSSSFESSWWGLDSSTPGCLESRQSQAGAVWMPSQGLIPLTWSHSPCIQIQVILPSSYWCSCNCPQIVPLAFLGGSSLWLVLSSRCWKTSDYLGELLVSKKTKLWYDIIELRVNYNLQDAITSFLNPQLIRHSNLSSL